MESRDYIRYEPLNDAVFNYMFAEQSLKCFAGEIINSVLIDAGDSTVSSVQELKTQYDVQKRVIGAHGGRLDVRAVASDGSLFDIEVQTYPEPSMNARSWFYGSGIMSEEFKEGRPYREIPKVRVINILDFSLRPNHTDILQPIGLLYRKDAEESTDAFRIYNVELPKFRALNPTLEMVKDDPLLRWLYLMDIGYRNDHELEVLSKMSEGMTAFAKRYKLSMQDPDLRQMYELEMSAKRDRASVIDNAKLEERTATIHTMLSNGIPEEIVYKSISAPRSEIDAIIAKLRASSHV